MLLNILDTFFTFGGVAVLISIIVFIAMMLFSKRLNLTTILSMIVIFVVTLVVMFSFPSAARYEIRKKLSVEVISVESSGTVNNTKVVEELKKISFKIAKNSHPLERFRFKVQTKAEDIHFELARDSNDSSVYWVFYPAYRAGRTNPVGKIILK
ncbi:hypothetical protein L4D09_24210 [Photobacterium makurazakiensis]|uniref:hypothetical protein n=1 Tax=Photobacterium makurazakiensis TaxID=2910234 RepID=UPI003D0CF27F